VDILSENRQAASIMIALLSVLGDLAVILWLTLQ